MMKFKKGDTVYLKAVVDDIKDHVTKGIRCNLGYEVGYTHCEDYHLFTKQEMLEELQKPELPKVGETWGLLRGSVEVQIVAVTDDNVFYEEITDRMIGGARRIDVFLDEYGGLSNDQ